MHISGHNAHTKHTQRVMASGYPVSHGKIGQREYEHLCSRGQSDDGIFEHIIGIDFGFLRTVWAPFFWRNASSY